MGNFDIQLKDWYDAEVGGKAFFDTLASATDSEVELQKLSLLAQLEATMAARLYAVCAGASITLPEESSREPELVGYAQSLAEKDWLAIMEEMEPQLLAAVAEVHEEASHAPPHYADIAGKFIAHEEALHAFVSAEVRGEDGSPILKSLFREWS